MQEERRLLELERDKKSDILENMKRENKKRLGLKIETYRSD
jgi:hypothetical protein